MLLARIYEAFPLICPICHAQIRGFDAKNGIDGGDVIRHTLKSAFEFPILYAALYRAKEQGRNRAVLAYQSEVANFRNGSVV